MSKGVANMKDSGFLDKNFNGLPDEVFNDIINFFDFPLEDVEINVQEDWDAEFKQLQEPCFDVFHVASSGLCGKTDNNSQLGISFPTSCNGVTQIKQLAQTAGPAYGKTITNLNDSIGKHLHPFQTTSPVSVFDSSNSFSSAENSNVDPPTVRVKRSRSKRQRPSSSSSVFSISFIPTSPLRNKVEKQKEKDLFLLPDQVKMKIYSSKESVVTRKCMHCAAKKTPQWREGPMGPKTLCNACGVRYRSGRLYPEYRPAVSPTFVPSLHSNNHKKVVEMRSKAMQEAVKGSMLSSSSSPSRNSVE
ncbi:putative transcription factor C2C2-GATA family [Lupinus albus]|uniref:Putative transcription factor C2C2-GATA family n=1 Tax=Lupinus albus TaxID=3870 RepID=A0A6A4NGF4_LUPAL|nr:putative transcription factor C2C2-GATA family [Lupinus albus]